MAVAVAVGVRHHSPLIRHSLLMNLWRDYLPHFRSGPESEQGLGLEQEPGMGMGLGMAMGPQMSMAPLVDVDFA